MSPATKIEYVDRTWKIVTGCLHGCPYCYVKRFAKDWNVPKFHPERLDEPVKYRKPAMWFVANTGDLFGDWVPEEWIKLTLGVIKECPQHTFLLLTKNPKRMAKYDYPPNVWVGTSVTCNADLMRIEDIRYIKGARCHFVSFEPLLEMLDLSRVNLIGINWCIVGAESIRQAHIPKDVVYSQRCAGPLIAEILVAKIPLFTKPNLQWKPEYKEMPNPDGGGLCPGS